MNKIGKLCPKSSVLFLCDMQEKFRPMISFAPAIVNVAQRVLTFAKLFEVPVVVTEQYPKGLGHTMKELEISGYPLFVKTQFSMVVPEVAEHLKTLPGLKSVVICGIEAHACVLQTVLDLLEKRFDVHVVVDGISSRSMVDRAFALQRMKEAGAFLTTSESLMMLWCKDASHPKFREAQKVIMSPSPDSGLLSSGTPV